MSTRSGPRRGRVLLSMLALALLGGCRNELEIAAGGAPVSTLPSAMGYAIEPTTGCLEKRGAAVGPALDGDDRLRALRDLAQTNSRQAAVGNEVVGMAFVASEWDAILLADIVRVPNDPYHVVTVRNVVLVYPPAAERALPVVVGCLSP